MSTAAMGASPVNRSPNATRIVYVGLICVVGYLLYEVGRMNARGTTEGGNPQEGGNGQSQDGGDEDAALAERNRRRSSKKHQTTLEGESDPDSDKNADGGTTKRQKRQRPTKPQDASSDPDDDSTPRTKKSKPEKKKRNDDQRSSSVASKKGSNSKQKKKGRLDAERAAIAKLEDSVNAFLGFPFYVRHKQLYLSITNTSARYPPNLWKVGPIALPNATSAASITKKKKQQQTAGAEEEGKESTADVPASYPKFVFPSKVTSVIVDVGTNRNPDTLGDEGVWKNESIGLVWFDPTRELISQPLEAPIVRAVQPIGQHRVMPFAAAVAPTDGTMQLNVAAEPGCTSLLPMSEEALRNAHMVEGGWRRDLHNKCTSRVAVQTVPVVSGRKIIHMIPEDLEIAMIAIDAQGFDLNVLSSFGAAARRANVIFIECQDLPEKHPLYIVNGAFSCADIKACIEAHLPHKMVDSATGQIANACQVNNPTTAERNCAFRRMDRPYWWGNAWRPSNLNTGNHPLGQGRSPSLKCPAPWGMGPDAIAFDGLDKDGAMAVAAGDKPATPPPTAKKNLNKGGDGDAADEEVEATKPPRRRNRKPRKDDDDDEAEATTKAPRRKRKPPPAED